MNRGCLGADGLNGVDGAPGPPGPQGIQGEPGPIGPQGKGLFLGSLLILPAGSLAPVTGYSFFGTFNLQGVVTGGRGTGGGPPQVTVDIYIRNQPAGP